MEESGSDNQDPAPPDSAKDPPGRDAARLARFISLLSDDDESARWKAAEALGRMRDPAAVDDLIGALWDDDARVRVKAAWALGQIGDRRAYAPLQRLFRMENERTQEIIEEALENIRRGMAGGT